MLPRIFDLFTQVDRSLDRSQGGLGVGLTLVRQLVEMHGGTVQVYSDGPNRGSEFVVRLPRGGGRPGGRTRDRMVLLCRPPVLDDVRRPGLDGAARSAIPESGIP